MADQTQQADPTTQYEQPESTDEQQPHPGLSNTMQDKPDHGEETYRGTDRLTGKRAVITGGDSGIGRAVALAFAREGADVLISYLESEERDADETVRLVEDAGRKAVRCPGDITTRARVGRSSTPPSLSSAESISWSTTPRTRWLRWAASLRSRPSSSTA